MIIYDLPDLWTPDTRATVELAATIRYSSRGAWCADQRVSARIAR